MTTPANPDDLPAFLRACYDERERTAVAAGGRGDTGQWHTPDGDMWAGRVEDAAGDVVVYDEGSPTEAQAAHIADNDPAYVLADLDAKRRILDECAYWAEKVKSGDPYPALADRYEVAMSVLRPLALPFAHRPGYREEWRPA